jgi:nitrite reductase/ring-hydroxylating ferredoxin subunit
VSVASAPDAPLPPGAVPAAALDDLPPGTLLGVEIAGRRICLAHAESGIYAFQDNCTHRDFPLSAGELDGDAVTCAWHGARFDCATGQVKQGPALTALPVYEARVDGNRVLVKRGAPQ